MKLEKLNKAQIVLTNDMMSKIVGGDVSYGTRQYKYSGGSAAGFGMPATDRTVQVRTRDAVTKTRFWSDGG